MVLHASHFISGILRSYRPGKIKNTLYYAQLWQIHWELEVPPACPDTKDCSAGQVLKALCGTGRDETGVFCWCGRNRWFTAFPQIKYLCKTTYTNEKVVHVIIVQLDDMLGSNKKKKVFKQSNWQCCLRGFNSFPLLYLKLEIESMTEEVDTTGLLQMFLNF